MQPKQSANDNTKNVNSLILFIWYLFLTRLPFWRSFASGSVNSRGSMKWEESAGKTKDFLYLISREAAIRMTFILCWEIHKSRAAPAWRVGLIAIVSPESGWNDSTATLWLPGVGLDSLPAELNSWSPPSQLLLTCCFKWWIIVNLSTLLFTYLDLKSLCTIQHQQIPKADGEIADSVFIW